VQERWSHYSTEYLALREAPRFQQHGIQLRTLARTKNSYSVSLGSNAQILEQHFISYRPDLTYVSLILYVYLTVRFLRAYTHNYYTLPRIHSLPKSRNAEVNYTQNILPYIHYMGIRFATKSIPAAPDFTVRTCIAPQQAIGQSLPWHPACHIQLLYERRQASIRCSFPTSTFSNLDGLLALQETRSIAPGWGVLS